MFISLIGSSPTILWAIHPSFPTRVVGDFARCRYAHLGQFERKTLLKKSIASTISSIVPSRTLEKIGLSLCILLFAFQAIAIVYARFIPGRYFCWAPYDTQDRYRVEVVASGRALSEQEIDERYRFASNSWQQHSIHNLLEAIEQYETTYGRDDAAKVTVVYSRNGRPDQTWRFPQ